ncbi:MAG: efflux RND transporter periplasmic adaptor subunit [Bryobacterales bacterium]|nr:efflux RND transporter periplasmic adaptor subunit [Bryobacterales bacterium]
MKKLIGIVVVVAIVGGVAWWLSRPAAPKRVATATVTRQTLTSTIITNGKVEPAQFASVRAQQGGAIVKVAVEKGAVVAAGGLLVELNSAAERAELQAAEARLAQAQADLKVLSAGGSAATRSELEGSIESTRVQLDVAKREVERTERLVRQNAETRETLIAAQDRVRQLETDLRSLERRRETLVPVGSRDAVEARVRDAEAAVQLAHQRIGQARVTSPVAGTVYNLAVRRGGYVQPGDLIAEVGQTKTVRVIVYVDEPELGRVSQGMPVEIRWDAIPNRSWKGQVEALPTQIVALNTRQVGEVVCLIDNEGGTLPPGANINAEIRSSVVENALAIPKAALRRGEKGSGVLVVVGDHVEFRGVELGTSSITHAEVRSGLKEGDRVVISTDVAVEPGDRVTPQP